ncbi:D-alanyl-D-alanine carboxypeptidase family protein [Streptomyces sp. R33]|uniref:D-alanyl-D-alanine carboxypeptidase family protein n=1 Tax=Streptomyces sp. R33 TaxID=3238629 RepID=A0AB39Y993_9ACTN
MVAIEEELVAGESPDKSVDEGASGAAMSSAERDPRLSVFRPREPESGTASASGSGSGSGEGTSRDPLREAVAAWVATTDAEAEADGSAAEPKPGAGSSGRVDSEAAAEAEGDSAPADSERTAVFRAPKPDADVPDSDSDSDSNSDSDSDSDSASGSDSASADESSDAERPRSEPASAKGRKDAPASAAAKPAAADAPAEKPGSASASAGEPKADSERTAVFRVPNAGSASASAGDKPAGGARTDSGSVPAADKQAAADAPADSERTAVFRAVKPGSPSPSGSAPAKGGTDAAAAGKPAADGERTAVFRAVKPGSGTDASASAAEKPAGGDRGPAGGSASGDAKGAAPADAADSERTAVFRAPKLDAASGAPKAPAAGKTSDGPADGERTAVFRAVKPDAKASPQASASASAPASASASASAPEKPAASGPVPPKAVGGERPSTFVPLRKDEGPASKPAASASPAAPAPAPAAPKPVVVPERTERTTQQPLPPKPPLDMLADLTNNPPPPPSPLRTAVRRFKIYAPLVALLAIILAVVQLVRPLPEPKLTMTAKSSYTFDGGNPVLPWPKEGQAHMAAAGLGTVGSFGEQKPIAIGSVAKTMTAYVILKNHPLKKGEKGPMIDVDKTAVDDGNKDSEGESTVNTLKAGDKISEYDALAAIMIPSANNVARLLARWDASGDQEAFVKKMNDAAKELGMTNTTYTDPSGLDATTVSTAEDQVKLGLKVVEMPELIAITKLPEWIDPSGKKWRNYNTLIPYNGALGIKTGSTTKAGGNLLFAAEKQVGKTRQLIVGAVLGQHGSPILDTAIAASKQVMLATQKMLVDAPVVKKGDVVGYVDDGLGGRTPVVATGDVAAVGWPSLTVDIKLAGGDGKLPQSAKAGTEIGVLTVGEGASQVKVPVALQSDLAAPGIGSKLTRVG